MNSLPALPCFRSFRATLLAAACLAFPVCTWGAAQGAIASGSTVQGTLTLASNDTWTFSGTTGDRVIIAAGDATGTGVGGMYMRVVLLNPAAVEVMNQGGDVAGRFEYTLAATGTFTIRVSDYYNTGTGPYRLHLVRVPDTQTISDGDQGGALTSGTTHSGSIHAGDLDPWTMTLATNDSIIIDVGENITTGLQPALRLFGPDGAQVAQANGNTAAKITYRALAPGTFTVVVLDSNGSGIGDYRLQVARAPSTQTISAGDEGGAMATGLNYTGAIHAGDIDVYTFTATTGDGIVVSAGETGGDTAFYMRLTLFGPDGATLLTSNGSTAARIVMQAPGTGTYTVIVDDYYTEAVGNYRVNLALAPGTQTVSPGDEGGAITSGATQGGAIGTGELDVWTMTLNINDTFYVSVGENTQTGLSPGLRLYGPNGAFITQANNSVGATIEHRATAAGEFTLVLFDNNISGAGDYRLHGLRIPGGNAVGDEGGALSSGQTFDATLHTADVDAWTFTANAGEGVIISAAETAGDTAVYMKISLYGPDGARIQTSNGPTVARLALHVVATGTFTVVVEDYYATASGPYRLDFAHAPEVPVIAPGDEGGPLISGQTHAGMINRGDVDVWTTTLAIGDSIEVAVGENTGTALNPALRLYGPSGATITNASGTVGAKLEHRALVAGLYTVAVFDNNTTGTGDYRLHPVMIPGGNDVGDEGGEALSNVVYTGAIHPGDLDTWTFPANAGEGFVVAVGETGTDTALYPEMILYGPDGVKLTSTNGSAAARIIWNPTMSGTHTVIVRDYYVTSPGTYRFNVVHAPDIQDPAVDDEGGAMTSGQTHPGAVPIGDLDAWTIDLAVNDMFVATVGENTLTGLSPAMRLYGPTGTYLATGSGTVGCALTHRATVAGQYTLVLYDNNTSGAGDYRLHPVRIPGPHVIGDDGGIVNNGQNYAGTIHIGDNDVWTIAGNVGDTLNIQLTETGGDTALYLKMTLYNTDGSLNLSTNGAASTSMSRTVTPTGLYTLVVEDYYSGAAGAYNLVINGISGTTQAPVIGSHPLNRTIGVGAGTTFSVAASGIPATFTYQRQRKPAGSGTWSNVVNGGAYTGATHFTLGVVNAALAMSGDEFRCIVSNGVAPNATSNAASLTIGKSDQTIQFNTPADRVYGAAPFDLTANASSSLPVSFTVLSGPATLNGGTLTLTGAGSVTIRASQAGNDDYNAAPNVDRTFNVAKATLTVTAEDKSRAYGASNPIFTYTATGFVNGETAAVLTGAPSLTPNANASSPVGAYAINATLGSLAGGNYAFSFVAGTLTITKANVTATADNKSRLYGAADPAFTITYTGLLNGETGTVIDAAPSAATTAIAASPVGTYAITLTGGTDNNYNLTLVNGTLTVATAPLTVTADPKSRGYGDANPALTYVITGFVNGETSAIVTGTATVTTTAVAGSPVGTYPITPAQGTLAAPNYAFTFVNGTLTIGRAALTITATSTGRIYGSPNPVFAYTATGFANGETVAVLSGAPSLTTTATASSPVGNYGITAVIGTLAATNYTFTLVNGTLSITTAGLAVTADDATRAYGAANPAFTATITGFVNGENSSVVSGTPTFTTTAVADSPVGTFPITPAAGTLAAPNYGFYFVNGTLTISQAALSAKADDKSKQQGTVNPTLTITYTGFVNGETAAVIDTPPTASTTAVTSSPNGDYPITLGGGTDDNYALTLVSGLLTVTTANVPPVITSHPTDLTVQVFQNAAFSVAASGVPSPTYQWQRKLAGSTDWLNLTNGGGVAGATTNTLTLTGGTTANSGDQFRAIAANGVNPDATSNAATLTVTKAPATVALASLGHIYDGTAKSATATTNPPGLSVTLTYDGSATAPTNAGSYTIAATINDANYAGATTGTLSIFKSPLTATADNLAKLQGAANPPLTITYTGLANGETAAVIDTPPTASTTATTLSPIGVYPITLSGGTDNNYTFTLLAGTLTITAGPVAPTIVSPPADLTVAFGADAAFGVIATGNPATFTYQWQRQPAAGGGFTNITNGGAYSGATTTALQITDATGAMSGDQFRVLVSNGVNPDATSAAATLTVTKADQTITFAQPGDKIYGAASFALTATATSGLTVTFTVVSGPATLNGDTLSLTGAGAVTIRASQAGNADYNPAPDVERTFTIAPAVLTVTAENKTRVFGAANPVFTFVFSGFVNTDLAVAVTGAPALSTNATPASSVGTYPINAAPGTLAAANYEFTFVAGSLTVTKAPLIARADDKAKIQGEVNPALTITFLGFLNGDNASALGSVPTATTTAATGSLVGTYPITLSGGTAANYTITLEDGVFTVTASTAPPTINEHPLSQTVPLASDVTLSVVASGADPLVYQWYRNGVVLDGANSATLALTDVTIDDQGSYSVRVTNIHGVATSELATLTVEVIGDAPVIIREPTDQTVLRDGRARFTVEAEGADPLTYQPKRSS